MIVTQQIKSINDSPFSHEDFIAINVLKWKDSQWKTLCPYYLTTDGNEIQKNEGGILFENFWQGSKVYKRIVSNEVYPSKYQAGNPKYLWWSYETKNKWGDYILDDEYNIDMETYLKWRNSIWSCKNPIRYPNKIGNRKDCRFALIIDANGSQTRMDYLTFRKEVYVREYIRLVKKTREYNELLDMLKQGKKLMICEIDVPAKNKRGKYNINNALNISEPLTLEYLEELLNDPSEAFGHGLALVMSLLRDYNNFTY